MQIGDNIINAIDHANDTVLVIPAWNEESAIGDVIINAIDYVNSIIVVDDCSSDSTAIVARSLGANVISFYQRMGYTSAVLAGIRHALSNPCNVIVTLDADGAHNPNEIPSIIDYHRSFKCDLTIGDRFMSHISPSNIPSCKLAANRFASCLFNFCCGTSFTDVASGFRVFSRPFAIHISNVFSNIMFAFPYLQIIEALKNNYIIGSHEISVRYDESVLHCTSQSELTDLICYISQLHKDAFFNDRAPDFSQIIKWITSFEPFSVFIDNNYFYFFPITFYSSYIIQHVAEYPNKAIFLNHYVCRARGTSL